VPLISGETADCAHMAADRAKKEPNRVFMKDLRRQCAGTASI
jgi:hypothetical protein